MSDTTYRLTVYTSQGSWYVECASAEEARRRQLVVVRRGGFPLLTAIGSDGRQRIYEGLNVLYDSRAEKFPNARSSLLDTRR